MDFPILGVDFLRHHSLLVDPVNNRLVDKQGLSLPTLAQHSPPTASLVTDAIPQHVPPPTLPMASSAPPPLRLARPVVVSRPLAASYAALLGQYPEVVNKSKRLPQVSHHVVHHIVTTGPPIAAKFRRLDAERS